MALFLVRLWHEARQVGYPYETDIRRSFTIQSNTMRETTMAVNSDDKMPAMSVTANP